MTDARTVRARAQPADTRAGDVGTLHAQSQAQAPAAHHRLPTLLIRGAQDGLVSKDYAAAYARL